jgi:hypothetical protein
MQSNEGKNSSRMGSTDIISRQYEADNTRKIKAMDMITGPDLDSTNIFTILLSAHLTS